MNVRQFRYFVGDFETTVYKNQEHTEVWASASVEMFTDDVKIFHSINDQYEYFKSLKCNLVVYYHNLKFDGAFWVSYLMTELNYTQALHHRSSDQLDVEWLHEKDMKNNTFKFCVSDKGMWYSITIKVQGHYIIIRDSLKLLPFSVRRIGQSFGTKHKKLDMEYEGIRYAGCPITEKEKEYIANDVLVVKEALEIMFTEGHKKLTIGSCCLAEYKKIVENEYGTPTYGFEDMFPNVYNLQLNEMQHKYKNAGEWLRRSYRGGWCYLVKGKENKEYKEGVTADVNSLYPSMMSSESGNRYPIGIPTFWKGNYIPDEAIADNKYYFVRIKTRFYIKDNMLPFIQIKSSLLYDGTEALETSDVYDRTDGKYYTHYTDKEGHVHDTRVELTMTMTDYQLFKEHYYCADFEILDGCWFYAQVGIFDQYIDKYKKIKMESKGALRELAKLFLNNLYGKMASSTDSSFKIAYLKDDGSLGFVPIKENNKEPGYIPIGSAITSYARNFTIRAAQKNYYGVDKAGFIYADTDSIHCNLKPEQVVGIKIDSKNFCCWKLESKWDTATFTRQKTYIEHVIEEDLEQKEDGTFAGETVKPYYNIKCAGMPQRCKDLFEQSMNGTADVSGYISPITNQHKDWTQDERDFLFDENDKPIKRTMCDFRIGLKVPGKLRPKRIKGGVLLVETPYEMR